MAKPKAPPKPPIRARLTDGSIVVLEKDCGCLDEIHVGPHWLHMDDVDRALNRQHLPQEGVADPWGLRAHAFIIGERARLQTKLYEMTSRNIAEILRGEAHGQESEAVGIQG